MHRRASAAKRLIAPPGAAPPSADAEGLYHSLVETLPQHVFRKDLQGRYTFGSTRFCRAVGLDPSELAGKTDEDLFPADVARQHREDDRRVVLSGGKIETVEERPADTGTRYIQVIRTPIRAASGEVTGIQGTFWDITQQKVLEQDLQRERDLLANLLRAIPDSIYFKDEQSRFLKVSQSLATRFGLERAEEAVGKSDLDYSPPERALKARAEEAEIMQTQRPLLDKVESWPYGDGRERWIRSTKMPLFDSTGRTMGIFGVSHDITELRMTQAALAVARDAAVESARLKSEFLANMSHEIRTPLNAIIGMSGLMLDTDLDKDQSEFATTIRSSGDLLLSIINDILDFSKIEAGKMTIERIRFDLTQIVEETADLLAESAQKKGLELVTWIPSHVPRDLYGDPARIRQVLANLLSNAVKFTATGEIVLEIGAKVANDSRLAVQFRVRDTGIGISAEAHTRLFTAFTQEDGSTTRRYGGTGLGLAICRQLVTLMGGEINFESVPGQGSTFWFELPLDRAAEGTRPRPQSRASLEGARLLVVDDNETNRSILHRQLAAWRMRDDEVASGPAALERLIRANESPDAYRLIVLDMQMPDMDGMSVVKAIRSDARLKDLRIVILTSLAYHPDEADLKDLDISAYLTKPVKQSRLFDALATALAPQDHLASTARPPVPVAGNNGAASPAPMKLRVLLAEDNRVNQRVALHQLHKLGLKADAVNNGVEVLEAIGRGRYDVILMDCQMPELDGYETTKRLRQLEHDDPQRLRHYVIALTANAFDSDRDACLQAGMDDYLSKPVRMDDLHHALERSLSARTNH